MARPPALLQSAAVSFAVASSMSNAATRAPALAIAVAIARPIPDPAPVTTATRSSRIIAHLSWSMRSDRQRIAVATRVRAGHERAGLSIPHDALAAAHHPGPVVERVDLVSARLETRARLGSNSRLGVDQTVAIHAHPR